MKKRNTTSARSITSLVFLMFFISIIFASCIFSNDKQKVHHVKYSREAVNKWLNDAKFDKLIIQFYLPGFKEWGNLQLFAYGVDEVDSTCKYYYLQAYADTLAIVRDSVETIDKPVVLGNLEIPRDKLYKLTHNVDGTERDYDFLFCKPKKDPTTNYVWYVVYATKNGVKLPPRPNPTDDEEQLNPRPPAP